MAAFSHHHQALLLGSHFSSNNNNNSPITPLSSDFISEQPSSYDNDNSIQTSNSLIFPQFCPPNYYNLHRSSLTDTSSQSDVENESSVTKKLQSPQSSVVVDYYNCNHNCKIESGDEQVTQIVTTNPSPPLMDRKRKNSAKLKVNKRILCHSKFPLRSDAVWYLVYGFICIYREVKNSSTFGRITSIYIIQY